MRVEHHIPANILKPFIKTFMIIESEEGTQNHILPDTSIVMAFRITGQVIVNSEETNESLPPSVITGLRKSSRRIDYSQQTATLLVIFREGGASAFFNEHLHELFNLSLSLDNLVDRQQTADVEEQLAEAGNNHQRILVVERFLRSRLINSSPDKRMNIAVRNITTMKGNLSMKELAGDLNMSQDVFEKKFRRVIGTSPKQFSSIVRFRNIIAHYSPDRLLTDLAYDAGYFDPSHFTKDFKSFTGYTPSEFLKSGAYW